ncbi:hypothetical protein BpHYR1_054312 [Brachionus plicatilis]|uniref:Uncharacterized protein n=1 Tax=Brachionus plicatilis TaxID=10195 RepID=A0A3M7T4V2_BRAPC|nr:hypothetical protein BpHYR1_054312 [Brachionus plicatilis]
MGTKLVAKMLLSAAMAAAVLLVGKLVQSPIPKTFGYFLCCRASLEDKRSSRVIEFDSGSKTEAFAFIQSTPLGINLLCGRRKESGFLTPPAAKVQPDGSIMATLVFPSLRTKRLEIFRPAPPPPTTTSL